MDDDDSVEFVALNPAGPSSPRRKPHHRRRAPPPPRRRGPFIAAQDVIEIQDSDEDEGVQPSEKGKGKARAVQAWRDNVEPSKGSPRKLPLFLPEIDSDSAEDVQAMLGAGDMLSLPPGRPYIQPSPKDKCKRSLKATVADRLSPRVENRPSPAALPPPSASNSLASIMPPVATTRIAAQVLEILPDVERSFLHRVIAHQISVYSAEGDVPDLDVNDDERIVQGILHVLFEDASYPKAPAIALLPGNPRPRAAANRMPRNNSPLNEKHKAAPLDSVMNRSTQSELDVYRLLEPDANDQGEGPAARPIASASSAALAPPPPAPEPEQGPVPRILAQVLEIIPDVEPTHVTKLIQHNLDIQRVDEGEGQPSSVDAYDRALQGVLHTLFENPDYPKVSKKRKRDAEDDGEGSGSKKAKALGEVDYADATRAKRYSKYYDELSLVSAFHGH
ncbi:hypothetical protein PHLGIDRAFT_237858 [Phlebiopsis gigantea 11061_1 CR5-6]|uniref:Uncharacterized protein n=1 Tax=Phlebiopsis gigantea (strain 11061_1 CR5-6) TaxID=745531 RepID=A0A0C3S1Z1_PHLG1|nr:hypothetical protein PHLGIDRAFT_237858 [Phlebiopsis gigantea 11061_1 CR5-6]